jgi:hypothetical protein
MHLLLAMHLDQHGRDRDLHVCVWYDSACDEQPLTIQTMTNALQQWRRVIPCSTIQFEKYLPICRIQ